MTDPNVLSFPRSILAPIKPRRVYYSKGLVALLVIWAFAAGLAIGILV